MRLYSLGTVSSLAFTLFASGCQGRGERVEDSPSPPSIDAAVVERENIMPRFKPLGRTSLNLSVKGAAVTIPADALPAGVEVTLTGTPVTKSDFRPHNGEKPITEVYTLKFSDAVRSRKAISLGIEVPQGIEKGFYGYVKITGAQPFGEFSGNSDWSLEIGRFDPKSRVLYFPFFATAQEISVVVVSRETNRQE